MEANALLANFSTPTNTTAEHQSKAKLLLQNADLKKSRILPRKLIQSSKKLCHKTWAAGNSVTMKYPYGRPRCVKLPKTSLDSAEDGINNSVSSTHSTAGSRYATCFYNVPKCNMRVRARERMWVSPTCFHEDILLEEVLFLEAYDPYQMFVRSRQHYRTLGIT